MNAHLPTPKIPMAIHVASSAVDFAVAYKNTRKVEHLIHYIQAEMELLRMHQQRMTNADDLARCESTLGYWNRLLINTTEMV